MDTETISKFTTVCVRCWRDYSYTPWGHFNKLFSSFVDFGLVCLSVHLMHTLSCYQTLPSRSDYRTASLEASLIKWSQCLKWLIGGCNCAELQEILAMGLVVVMLNISRCAPWLKVLWLCRLNPHHCMFLAQDEACRDRRWVTAAAFLLRVGYSRLAVEWAEQELLNSSQRLTRYKTVISSSFWKLMMWLGQFPQVTFDQVTASTHQDLISSPVSSFRSQLFQLM